MTLESKPKAQIAPKPAAEGGPRFVSYTCGRAPECEHKCRVWIGPNGLELHPVEPFHGDKRMVITSAREGTGINTYR